MTATRDEAVSAIFSFLREDNPELQELDPHMDLIDNRLIDSLKFMNFIFLLEELTGMQFSIDQITVDDFRSVHRIQERFLKELPHAA